MHECVHSACNKGHHLQGVAYDRLKALLVLLMVGDQLQYVSVLQQLSLLRLAARSMMGFTLI